MSATIHAGRTSRPVSAEPETVRVWDPVVRLFHWGVVAAFGVAFITGEHAGTVHRGAGYLIVGLLLVRVVWGFIGPRHARFSDFVRSPRAAWEYLVLSCRGKAPRYLGHNPAGGLMAIALMVMLAAIALTGHLMTTAAWWGSETMENLHEALVNGTIGLIVVHILGNLFSSLVHRENLTRSMITGRKRAERDRLTPEAKA